MPRQIKLASTVTKIDTIDRSFNDRCVLDLPGRDNIERNSNESGKLRVMANRRSLKRRDDRNCWWIDLPEPLCRKANLETGTTVELIIRLASEDLPEELKNLLAQNRQAKERWAKLTKGQQRMLREEIWSARTTMTRTKRAEKWLLDR